MQILGVGLHARQQTISMLDTDAEELAIECQVGHPAKARAAEPRTQKHDRRDAALIRTLLSKVGSLRSGCLRSYNAMCELFSCILIGGPHTNAGAERASVDRSFVLIWEDVENVRLLSGRGAYRD